MAGNLRADAVECEEKKWRVAFYKSAVAHYSGTVKDLGVGRGKIRKADYVGLLALSELARLSSESARLELEKHTQEHGC